MRFWKHMSKRGLALFLALTMCLGLVQLTAFAQEGEESAKTAVYRLACTVEEHIHGERCYVHVSALPENGEGHVCTRSCYDLRCAAAEHVHGRDCYELIGEFPEEMLGAAERVSVYACGQEGHTHNFLCGIPETAASDETARPEEPESPAAPGGDGEDSRPETPAAPGGGEESGEPETPAVPGEGEEDSEPETPAAPGGDGEDSEPETPAVPGGDGEGWEPETPAAPGEEEEGGEPEAAPPAAEDWEREEPLAGDASRAVELPEADIPLAFQPVYSGDYCAAAGEPGVHIHGSACGMETIWTADPEAMAAPADNFSAQTGGVSYETLAEAVEKAAAGDTVTLLKDITESVALTKSLTFDLGGHTWTGSGDTTLKASTATNTSSAAGVDLTVKNGTMRSDGGQFCVIEAKAPSFANSLKGSLTLEDVVITGQSGNKPALETAYLKTVTITDSRFTENTCGSEAVIVSERGDFKMYGTEISHNEGNRVLYPELDILKLNTRGKLRDRKSVV